MNASIYANYQEKNNVIDKELPIISFTPFETRRLKNTEVVWINKELLNLYGIHGSITTLEKYLIKNFSYVSDNYAGKNRIVRSDRKVFWADRYGSRHEVCNGGSARCGFDGKFQVKGIGLTPLLAQNMSKSHSHGKLFLDEAILEAIWGEICHKHLPFGAVRTVAIIKTNVNEEFQYLSDSPKKPCALAIREFAIRPAHFERATFFWPLHEYMHLRDNDALRVQEAIKILPELLNSNAQGNQTKQNIIDSFEHFIYKLAKQIAYSRVKGIPHGSLTSSNIGLDCRFLDFGTITAVPDFGNYVLADGVGATWDDHLLIGNWLQNLMVSINKYSRFDSVFSNEKMKKLVEIFYRELDEQENISILEELDVKNKNHKNIQLALEIKNELISTSRQSLGDFCSDCFKEQIESLAKGKGLEIGNLKFNLRDFKYSSFRILNEYNSFKCSDQKEIVKKIISQYC
ncbi:protein adenylyltransferase SelO family protein [Vibrio owensii]|uniref:protein adenylyltransferase SelO family protein n=1 Tax=Vibrio owensii TaxID=696485 RepID=UPI0005F08299|nr:protein adenylyltransferase SelO family protein [Vibrio owensii]